MAFDWKEYLALAQYLQSFSSATVSPEAALRCASSRAYYAAYCHARNYAIAKQGFVPTGSPQDHTRLRTHFQGQRMPVIATGLDKLRIWRNDCDYDDAVPNLAATVAASLIEANQIV